MLFFLFFLILVVGDINISNFPEIQVVSVNNLALELDPIFQVDAVYGMDDYQTTTSTFGDGSVSTANSLFNVNGGTTSTSFGVLESRKRLYSRERVMFSASYTSGSCMIGLGHGEDGVYFANNGGEFGIMYVNNGLRETWNLTISAGSLINQNVVLTLAGVSYNVPVTGAVGNTYRLAYEVYKAGSNFKGWDVQLIGPSITFVYTKAVALTGSFSITGVAVVGSFVKIQDGVVPSSTFVAQSSWNGDQMNGLDVTLLNVYQIVLQNVGGVKFYVQTSSGEFALVHSLQFTNSMSTTYFGNPSFPFSAWCYGPTAMANVGMFTGEGKRVGGGGRFSIENALSSLVDAGSYWSLFSVINPVYIKGRTNQANINIISLSAATASTNPVTFSLYRTFNVGLLGNPNFQPYGPVLLDKASTTFTPATTDQLLAVSQVTGNGNAEVRFDTEILLLQPGDALTVVARTRAGVASWVSGAVTFGID